jgi:hypothetical protein
LVKHIAKRHIQDFVFSESLKENQKLSINKTSSKTETQNTGNKPEQQEYKQKHTIYFSPATPLC